MKLNAKHQIAAVMVAEDRLTDDEIAARAQVHRSTLAKWKLDPDFTAAVKKHTAALTERAMEHGIARREIRLGVLQDAHNRILQVIEERAAAPEMQNIPGGRTGLLVRIEKVFGVGTSARTVEEFAFDAALVREIRSIHVRAARELGQEVDKRELNAKGNIGLTWEAIDAILEDDD